jgi:hypothetical protein
MYEFERKSSDISDLSGESTEEMSKEFSDDDGAHGCDIE